MKFSPASLDRWATWLDIETSYALTKFTTAEQLSYFEAGVKRSDFSFADSAVGYLNRAALRPHISLRVVQEIGKSAHNHMACAAVARVWARKQDALIPAYFDIQDEWRAEIEKGEVEPISPTAEVVADQFGEFGVLQRIQDAGNVEGFDNFLMVTSLPIHAGFICLAETVGWPTPGISSSEDVRVWDIN